MTNFLLGCMVGLLLGTTFSAKAQYCCAQFDIPFNNQLEMDHAAGIAEEFAQPDIPLPRYTFPELPCAK